MSGTSPNMFQVRIMWNLDVSRIYQGREIPLFPGWRGYHHRELEPASRPFRYSRYWQERRKWKEWAREQRRRG